MADLVTVELSKRQLKFTPDSENTADSELDIVVKNNSNQFASFQLELVAPGVDPNSDLKWYTTEPKVSVKKPPGQTTRFRIRITRPPIRAYETTIPLTLRAFSVESEALATEESLSLEIKKPGRSLKIYLPNKTPTIVPGDRIEIPVVVYNLSPKYSRITLTCSNLDESWLQPGAEQVVAVDAADSESISFWCQPPADIEILSQHYEFQIEAKTSTSSYTTLEKGTLSILPWGTVDFHSSPPQRQFIRSGWHRRMSSVVYPLSFTNYSNLSHHIELSISEREQQLCELDSPESIETLEPGETRSLSLVSHKRSHWIGLPNRFAFRVFPALYDPISGNLHSQVQSTPAEQQFELVIPPRIPVWLQLLIGFLTLLLLYWTVLLNPSPSHAGVVNSVRFIANGSMVITGSGDRTIKSWQVDRNPWQVDVRRLHDEDKIVANARDAVQVIRQIPTHEREIAAGLGNGEIKLWDVPSKTLLKTLLYQNTQGETPKGNRVFDLVFTRDSRYLFSAHGSGSIYQWDISQSTSTAEILHRPIRQASPGFVISALAVSEDLPNPVNPTLIVAGGRYNKLAVWNPSANKIYQLSYPDDGSGSQVVGQLHYVTGLAMADNNQILISADNQGYIRVWDMARIRQCVLQQSSNSQSTGTVQVNGAIRLPLTALDCGKILLDQWWEDRDRQAVRSVALSQAGDYLASAGDDGRVMLWCLNAEGIHQGPGKEIHQFRGTRLNSVDIKALDNMLLVASDADQNRVRLFQLNRENNDANCQ